MHMVNATFFSYLYTVRQAIFFFFLRVHFITPSRIVKLIFILINLELSSHLLSGVILRTFCMLLGIRVHLLDHTE